MKNKKISAFSFMHDKQEIIPEKSLLDLIELKRSIVFNHDDYIETFDQIEFCSIDEDQCLVAINKSGDRLVGFIEYFDLKQDGKDGYLLVKFNFS